MKKYTWAQIHNAFAKSLKKDWHQSDLLNDIAAAPFHNTVINLGLVCDVRNASGNVEERFNIPLHIKVNDVDIKRAILMEIATQLYKFGKLNYYDDAYSPLEFSEIYFQVLGVFSTTTDKYAIFHQEQECGSSWLVVSKEDLDAPFTYKKDYTKNGDVMRRHETNRTNSYSIKSCKR